MNLKILKLLNIQIHITSTNKNIKQVKKEIC
jgi:hypothetical protein